VKFRIEEGRYKKRARKVPIPKNQLGAVSALRQSSVEKYRTILKKLLRYLLE
jgi:hypothetical protein